MNIERKGTISTKHKSRFSIGLQRFSCVILLWFTYYANLDKFLQSIANDSYLICWNVVGYFEFHMLSINRITIVLKYLYYNVCNNNWIEFYPSIINLYKPTVSAKNMTMIVTLVNTSTSPSGILSRYQTHLVFDNNCSK